VPPYPPPNMNRMWLKLTEISRLENGSFSNACEKCHVNVTVGGASVASTSGFRFLVGHDLNGTTCSGDFLANTYFRSDGLSKVGEKILDLSFRQF